MKNILRSGIIGIFLILATCLTAGSSDSAAPGMKQLEVKAQVLTEGYTVILYAAGDMDGLDVLLDDIQTVGSETAASIAAKVEKARAAHFPDAEIRLDIIAEKEELSSRQGGEAQSQGEDAKFSLGGQIRLVSEIYWWNIGIGWNEYWMHCEQSSAASGFVQTLGGQNYIYSFSDNDWYFQADHSGQRTWASSSYGYWQWRCFGAIGGQNVNTAHAVMFFYD